MTADPQVLPALWRSNLYFFVWKAFGILHPGKPFIPAPHVEAICWQLQQVEEGRCRRLLITVPPRHLKSVCTSVCFIAWLLGRDPGLKILVASYGQDLAAKHARDFRTVIDSLWYRRTFTGMRVHPKRNTEAEIMTTKGGGRKAVSLGGAVTGFGGDILIVDDLMKAADAQSPVERQRVKDFYEQTLYSRLNNKESGRIVAIQQRLHEDDLAGYLIDKQNFTHLNFPAIAEQDEAIGLNPSRTWHRRKGDALFPEQESRQTLEGIRREIGAYAFSAQYQQNPVPPEGNRIRWEWFGTYQVRPDRDYFQMVVQSWDTAVTAEPTSDFSVCATWGYREGNWYLLDLFRARLEYPELKRRVAGIGKHWNVDKVLIEWANSGIPLFQELRQEGMHTLFACSAHSDKETRLAVQTAKLETGAFLLPASADWLPGFRNELLAFPNGRHDDQVDSLAQFLHWTGSPRGRGWLKRQLDGGRPPRPQRINRPQSLKRR